MARELWRRRGLLGGLSMPCFIGMGETISFIGLLFNPVRAEFGWTNEQVSVLASAFLITMSLSTLLAGGSWTAFGASFPDLQAVTHQFCKWSFKEVTRNLRSPEGRRIPRHGA